MDTREETGNLPDSLMQAIRASATSMRRSLGGHPTPEELLAYSDGELSQEADRRLRSHLALCPECTQTVIDLKSFSQVRLRDEAMRLSADEKAEDWTRLQKRLVSTELGQKVPRRSVLVPWTLAAVLAGVVLALSLWMLDLQRHLFHTLGSKVNFQVVELSPEGEVARGTSPWTEITVPAGVDAILLILTLSDLRSFDSYLAVVYADEKALHELRGLLRFPDGSFSLALEREMLRRGDMKIDLFGLRGSEQTRLAAYHLQINIP